MMSCASCSACRRFFSELGENRLRLVAQLAGFVELGRDAFAAIVERLDRGLVHAELPQDAEKDHERDRHPEFGFQQCIQHGVWLWC